MKLIDYLDDEQLAKLNHMGKQRSKGIRNKSSKKEVLNDRDLKELMGVNRDTYRKVNGRIRKK